MLQDASQLWQRLAEALIDKSETSLEGSSYESGTSQGLQSIHRFTYFEMAYKNPSSPPVMNLMNYPQSTKSAGKRPWDGSDPTTPPPMTKKRKQDDAFTSYPTPDSIPTSITDSSSEESGRNFLQHSSPSKKFRSTKRPRTTSKSGFGAINEAEEAKSKFLADLVNYIAFGSCTIRASPQSDESLHDTDWIPFKPDTWPHLPLYAYETTHAAFHSGLRKLSECNLARVECRKHQNNKAFATIRVYVLPDDVGRRFFARGARKATSNLWTCLLNLVDELDSSIESWEGRNDIETGPKHYDLQYRDEDSLFYLFNTLPSPKVESKPVNCQFSNDSIQSILQSSQLNGLNTPLYPYQKRTVARMIQREVQPHQSLDPRFQLLSGPTGQQFLFDDTTGVLLQGERRYEEARGGILGESMGLGKTLICLATILATQGHWPEVPPEYSIDRHPKREEVGSLMEMAAAAVGRARIPWRTLLQDAARMGEHHGSLSLALERNRGFYVVTPPEPKWSRRSSNSLKGETILLSTATLIIVPQNLVSQWRSEISTHIEHDRLEILYLELKDQVPIPAADDLLQYDVVLISRPRFEREMIPSEHVQASLKSKVSMGGCLCSSDKDCYCSRTDEYMTPLKDIHWLRIIMDEGHEFSSSGKSGSAFWALRNLRVDRKWIVSGTPANGLLGVEVGTAINETFEAMVDHRKMSNRKSLEVRRKESALSQERKDLEKLGVLVTGFLQVKPWANSKEDDPASWQKYIMPHHDGRRKTSSLRRLLESLVVRHRIEDIEADIQLPPLHNRVIYLQPSWHDKLSINLFLFHLTVNAVTSERVDQDYMFNPKNRSQLNVLVNNLRQAGFFWTGLRPEWITEALKLSRTYLDKHQGEASPVSRADNILLEEAMKVGELALRSGSWKSFAELHEMGMYVVDFPEKARSAWSLVSEQQGDLLLIGTTQLAKAQKWVDSHLYASDPSLGLADAGVSTMQKLWQSAQHDEDFASSTDTNPHEGFKQNPTSKSASSLPKVPRLTNERTMSRVKTAPVSRKSSKVAPSHPSSTPLEMNKRNETAPALKSALKNSTVATPQGLLPSNSSLAHSRLQGTASAKLSYLLDRVTALHCNEKILIFYEGDPIAWYIAQALDLIDIRYLIYTRTLSLERQTVYIATFNKTETFRVLLMNVNQAAHGLHIASASRVFFVNPVWQPNVEAQAIKRAHRIGQTRPVFVETLVLKDTLEDQMLQRRKRMTAQEHQKAERSLLDDEVMSNTIKEASMIPLLDEEACDESRQMAKLETPHQIFGRSNQSEGNIDDPDADLIFPEGMPISGTKGRKQRRDGKTMASMESPVISGDRISLANDPAQVDGMDRGPPGPGANQDEVDRSRPFNTRYEHNSNHTPSSTQHTSSIPTRSSISTTGTNLAPPATNLEAFSPSSSNAIAQTSISSCTMPPRPKKRVGFAIEAPDTTEDQSPSLFGNAAPR